MHLKIGIFWQIIYRYHPHVRQRAVLPPPGQELQLWEIPSIPTLPFGLLPPFLLPSAIPPTDGSHRCFHSMCSGLGAVATVVNLPGCYPRPFHSCDHSVLLPDHSPLRSAPPPAQLHPTPSLLIHPLRWHSAIVLALRPLLWHTLPSPTARITPGRN